jgi:hypothetical protein
MLKWVLVVMDYLSLEFDGDLISYSDNGLDINWTSFICIS